MTPKKMPCGVHVKPKKLTRAPEFELTHRSKQEKLPVRYQRELRVGEKRGDCLCDYWDFPALRKEREMECKVDGAFRLMDLPGELRDNIYRHALVTAEAIEFCPEPYDRRRFQRDGEIGDYKKTDAFKKSDGVRKSQEDYVRESVKAFAKLVRANRQVHTECIKMFYRENEFRFSNSSGWPALEAFLYKIGIENAKVISKITICHPAFLELPDTNASEGHYDKGMLHVGARSFVEGSPFYNRRWSEYDSGWTVALLEKLGTLRQLRLLLPSTCTYPVGCPVDASRFGNLAVTFSSFSIDKSPSSIESIWGAEPTAPEEPEDWDDAPARPGSEERPWAQEIVEASGNRNWSWQKIVISKDGFYSSIDEHVAWMKDEDEVNNVHGTIPCARSGCKLHTPGDGGCPRATEIFEVDELSLEGLSLAS